MSYLIFRDAVPADISVMLTLSHAGDSRGSDTPPLDPATFTDSRTFAAFAQIAADPAHRLVVAERDGEVIGTLQITIMPGLPNFGMSRGILENVHIRADQRGSGHGSRLVRWAIAYCRERGCGTVQLTSNKVRTDAHRFYRTLGFQQSHEGFKLKL
ncbi:GNAT family N-acetyltransferase [uncultured Devosia sp.]|uniref:GNAT family N-acetyltransferase n=1 Tax=uncultured Devosia sp. TaxID=211434 RepID=UPI0035CB1AE8